MNSLAYRSEVDGLRAIAVLSVVLYHSEMFFLDKNWFTGGYIGVDIFFVISGYLISKIILLEIISKQSFSFANFYERRARRILPMLFFVILASFPFAWHYLLVADFLEYSKSILSSVFFGSNFFFYFLDIEYGDHGSLFKPFLHTWSLGIEEQFYIFFPILVFIFYKTLKIHFLTLLLAMFFLSLQFSESMNADNAELNFYLPLSRFWELLIGSVLAFLEIKNGRFKDTLANQIFPVVGLYLIVWSILSFDKTTSHPSFKTLIPLVGVALIIAFCSGNDLVGKILGSKSFVGLGLISYSVYLWHFPVFAFSRMNNLGPTQYDKIGWIALTLALSVLSYFLIEKPFRKKGLLSSRVAITSLLSFGILICGIQLLVIENNGFKGRVPEIFRENFSYKPWEQLESDGKICFDRVDDFCAFESDESFTWIKIIGDSHLSSIELDLFNRTKDRFNMMSLNNPVCWPIRDAERYNSPHPTIKTFCGPSYQSKRLDAIDQHENSIVIIGGRLPLYLHGHSFDNKEGGVEGPLYTVFDMVGQNIKSEDAMVSTLMEMLEKGHRIILLYPIPEAGWNVPMKVMADKPFIAEDATDYLQSNPITTSYMVYLDRVKSSFALLDRVQHENVYRVYPHKLFCDNQIKGRCVNHDEKNLYYSDDDHVSNKGAAMINDLIIEKLEEIASKDRMMQSYSLLHNP